MPPPPIAWATRTGRVMPTAPGLRQPSDGIRGTDYMHLDLVAHSLPGGFTPALAHLGSARKDDAQNGGHQSEFGEM